MDLPVAYLTNRDLLSVQHPQDAVETLSLPVCWITSECVERDA